MTAEFVIENRHVVVRSGMKKAGMGPRVTDAAGQQALGCAARDWLKRIVSQMKANLLVDREALDNPDLVFKREGGGFKRLNKIFDGELQ